MLFATFVLLDGCVVFTDFLWLPFGFGVCGCFGAFVFICLLVGFVLFCFTFVGICVLVCFWWLLLLSIAACLILCVCYEIFGFG